MKSSVSRKKKESSKIIPRCAYCQHFGEVSNYMAKCRVYNSNRPPNFICKKGVLFDQAKYNINKSRYE